MRTAVALTALLLALGGVAAGCGGDDGGDEAAPPATETTETEGTSSADGAAVFASAGCGGCHTLAAAGSGGSVGPNLDDAAPSVDTVVDRVTNGRGAMPSFSGSLSEDEILAVAEYVSSSAGS